MKRQAPHTSNAAARTLVRLAATAFFICALSFAALADEATRGVKVEQVSFPVTLSDGNTYNVAGRLYYQGSSHNRTLLVALHGGNYNGKYWDVPAINGHDYSFARYMAARKYAVLAIDQLGTGESDKPDGDLVTLANTGGAIHQIITQLRTGANGAGHAFGRVVLVGHSLGSINAVYEQGTYHDADALITTGLGHVPHDLPIPPEVIGGMLQQKYFPFPDDLRAQLFYYAPGADPDVMAYDRDHLADLLARGQLTTAIFASFDPLANRVGSVTGPVLVQFAEFDALFPVAFANQEAAYYASASSVTVQTVPGVGHDINTHLGNQESSWRLMDEWLTAQGLDGPGVN